MRRVTLRHQQLRLPQQIIHFYDGMTIARDGVVDDTLTDVHIEAVWRRGFNTTLDGRRIWDTEELFKEVERQNS